MTSLSHRENLHVGNHVDRHGSSHKQHRSDVETGSSHSSTRSSSRSHGHGDQHRQSRDESGHRRSNHEKRSSHESGTSSRSQGSSRSPDSSSHRRSSRHFDNDLAEQLMEPARMCRQRNMEQSSNCSNAATLPRRKSSQSGAVDYERHARDTGEYSDVDPYQTRSSTLQRRHQDNCQGSDESSRRHSSRREIPSSHSQSSMNLRRSSSRDHYDLESEQRETRRSSRVRNEERDYSRHERCRDSSQAGRREHEPHSRDHRSSSHSRRNYPSDHSNGTIERKRMSRSEYEQRDDRRDSRRDHSEARESLREDNGQGHMRKRSSSTLRENPSPYNNHRESSRSMSNSRKYSSSRQSLTGEDMESLQGSVSSRTRHESSGSHSRNNSESRHNSEGSSSRRRSRAPPADEDNVSLKMVKAHITNSNASLETVNSASTQKSGRQRHSPTRQERLSSELSGKNHRGQKEAASREESGRISDRSTQHNANRQSVTSSNRRRSASPHDDQDSAPVPTNKPDVSLSRRSSSSRSNYDTGFASSSSSPRRDDSQSRFSSDASPSRHGDEDNFRSRVEESRRRRRSKMVTNNSLDVPGGSLRKEQSLSSSGRGDSSFEETSTENKSAGRGSRRNLEEQSKEAARRSNEIEMRLGPDITTKELRTKRESQTPDTHPKASLGSSKNSSRSTNSLAKENHESPKSLSKTDVAEWASSTSTLRGGNVTSKTSIAGSFSSLLGRVHQDQQPKPGTNEETAAPVSVSERWRRLKQGILPDNPNSGNLTGKENAAAIFTAAAARFMSSLPKVAMAFPKGMTPSPTPAANDDAVSEIPVKDSVASLAKTEVSPVPKTKSEISVASQAKTNSSRQSKTDLPSPHLSVVSNHVPNNVASQRPSVISTTLSSHNKRANVYGVMTEKKEEKDSPDTEESGEMTPPSLDTDMKRRSKEVDGELTSFLPAEMSRREEKFHDAARVNDAVAIKTLLKERVNVNCRNSLDRTALHWAAANGNLESVEALIEGGADLEAKDKYGMRAVLWSAWFGHIPVLRTLVNAGANTRAVNKQGLGIIHCAAENNHVAVISFIFESLEPHDVNLRDKNERTPLHSAAESGHVEAVSRLLEAKADLHKKDKRIIAVDGEKKGGMTAVHLAAKLGHIDVLKALLLQGVEVDDRDVDGKTALHLAAEAGHKEAVDLLLDYTANPNSENVKEVTPLHLAAIEGHVEVCKSLVKYGCNVNAQNFQGNTALHLAANGNHKEVARVLVDAKCELDLPNSRMQTPLHVAVESGHLEVVQILLAGGASLDAREKSGKSALQVAARGNFVSVVDMLIKAERYYAYTREYHDKDVGYVDPDTYLRKPQHPHAPQMKEVLWKLATKQLKPTDWKKLAYHWHFTPEHVRAIEQEYTGNTSYKEHTYRLLTIWLHGVRKDENVLKLLYEALVAIDKKQLAESVRRKINLQAEKPCSPSLCSVS